MHHPGSFENVQCERTTQTMYTSKRHRIVHKNTIWDAPIDFHSVEKNIMEVNGFKQLMLGWFGYQHS